MVAPDPTGPRGPAAAFWSDAVVLVTGAASGVGAASARDLAGRGARVALVDVDPSGWDLATELGGMFVRFDVADHASWMAGVAAVVERWGQLDVAHLNAGVTTRSRSTPWDSDPVLTFTEERYRRIRGVNLDGVIFGVMATAAHLEAGGGGHIVVTASVSSLEAMPSDPFYAMTKHATVGFVRSAVPGLAARGVAIQALCPMGVDTPMINDDQRAPGRTFAPPGDVVAALVAAVEHGSSGDVWVARGPGDPYVRHQFAPARESHP